MAKMVVTDDNIAVAVQKAGKGIVAPDMLGNAVKQLNDAGIGGMIRQPLPGVDRAQAGAGWKVEVGDLRHGRRLLSVQLEQESVKAGGTLFLFCACFQ